ncbi:dTMP kinase [Pullulanibacillus pueri]|uniref:Thymidylate kinase n=1 Tax=Pullulanibacillus pueri TaxID=1437324 RepID=A0A8J3A044_9BACL|nr:dTMP kinase [Pullulanibacillus pueri]MBM7683985.1 dTMP kinase [Pullulanibacillus pueri]GGH88376.1 thymidylate kinase [Pullulanibacillus pueri]
MNGLFITFEGPDGAGKSTQLKKLGEYIEELGLPFIKTREPGGTKIGDAIRSILLDPSNETLTEKTEVLLYAASRAQHVQEVILPALQAGKIVLCDRFVDASIAYQGYGLDLSLKAVKIINEFAIEGITPHRTYLIDLPPDQGRLRMVKRQRGDQVVYDLDRIEQKNLSYHQKVRAGFHQIYNESKERICLIDGTQSIEAVFQEIKQDFQTYYKTLI